MLSRHLCRPLACRECLLGDLKAERPAAQAAVLKQGLKRRAAGSSLLHDHQLPSTCRAYSRNEESPHAEKLQPASLEGSSTTAGASKSAKAKSSDVGEKEDTSLPVRAALGMLQFYRQGISPLMQSSCRFVPSCSEYSIASYKKFGVWRGSVLTAWRLVRCNPWGSTGYDPPTWPPKGLEAVYNVPYTPEGVAILPIHKSDLSSAVEVAGPTAGFWVAANKFKGTSGEVLLVPNAEGGVGSVLVGLDSPNDIWGFAALPSKLPPGTYHITPGALTGGTWSPDAAALGWLLGQYTFERYKHKDGSDAAQGRPVLVWPAGTNRAYVEAASGATAWARDLITTPAEDMGPQHLAQEATLLARHHGASVNTTSGEDLLAENYPAIHTVGRASYRPPVLIDLRWSASVTGAPGTELPLLALVGKGVCFDSGGLDLKTPAGMKLMKKDMGGAALVLALAHLVMSQQLPVRLRVLVPAVENSVSGNAYRPLDVLQTRAGITVENGNTDAEGRLILADALCEAASEEPDLLIDAATLTGARNVALGSDMAAVFSTDDALWAQLASASDAEADPLWRLPLHRAYRKALESKVADIHSTGSNDGGGAITAALFLCEFVKDVPRWLHVDTPAYNNSSSPGKPEGGEAVGLRALWRLLQARYAPVAPAASAVASS